MRYLRALGGLDDTLIERAAPRENGLSDSVLWAEMEHDAVKTKPAASCWSIPKWAKLATGCLAAAILVALPYAANHLRFEFPQTEIVTIDKQGLGNGGSEVSANTYKLVFNKAKHEAAESVNLPMMFGRDLTDDERKAVLPRLSDTHSARAYAQFFYHDHSFYSVEAKITSTGGLTTDVSIAKDKVVLDYDLGDNTETTVVAGTPVTAGYFVTKPNSKGLRNIIYFASFQIDGVGYYVEICGDSTQKDVLRKEFSTVIGLLIGGGAADIARLAW